ncbi:MAG: hypothetical protein ACRD2N_23410 [Vicinamibacterales bacterium]
MLAAKLSGRITVPGDAATVLAVTFFGGLNCAGLGIVGAYVWRTYENSMRRPQSIVATHDVFRGRADRASIIRSDPAVTRMAVASDVDATK